MDNEEIVPPARRLVLREREFLLLAARQKLKWNEVREVAREMDAALALPDDEATLVLDTIKTAWELRT